MKIFKKISIVLFAMLVIGLVGSTTTLAAGPAVVNLGTASNFSVLAETLVSDANPTLTSITGNVGVHPAAGTFITGLSCTEVIGTIYDNNAGYTGGHDSNTTCLIPNSGVLLGTAVSDMEAAYTDAATRIPGVGATNLNVGGGTLNGQNFVPGTYTWNGPTSNVTITGDITLTGTATDVWIFQVAGTLDLATDKKIILAGGASADNVFWAIAGSTTLFPGSTFEGNILAQTNIAMQLGATLNGRALAQTAVTLIGNTISNLVAAIPVPVVGAANVGGSYIWSVPPLIDVVKIPSPLALPNGPGLVKYTYTLRNIGAVPMTGITLVDSKCKSINLVSGDTNGNGKFDTTETWIYTCQMNLSETTTNSVVVTGWTDGLSASDIAVATVVVGKSIVPPLIHVEKTPNLFLLSTPGGAITYTYKVTNPGTAPLTNVHISDNKCTNLPEQISGHPGDLNKNGLLDSNETWTFTCKTNVAQTTTNIGKATGFANGLVAVDLSPATVIVAPIKLPATGTDPSNDIPWNVVIPVGVLVVLLAVYFITKKKVV